MNNSCPPEVEEYFNYAPLLYLQYIQLGCSVVSICIVFYTLNFHLRKSWFEGVFKETMYALYLYIVWHSIFTIVLQTIQISQRLSANTPCEMQFNRKFCILRIMITLASPSFVLLHATLTAQRILTTFSGNRVIHKVIARLCLLLTLSWCVGYLFVGYRDYLTDEMTPFCAGFTSGGEPFILKAYFLMMLADFLNVVITFMLLFYNRKKIHQLTETPLDVKFRHRQTYLSIQQMLPVAFLNLLCCSMQYAGATFGYSLPLPEVHRTIVLGYFYAMPYYCVCCPAVLLLIMINEERKKRKELESISTTSSEAASENYFAALHSQWERYLPISN